MPPFLITWVAGFVGEKFAKPLVWAGLILLLVGSIFLLGRCTAGDDTDEAQIEQTTRSSDAIATAAEDAIETLEGRTATEDAIDQVVAETVTNIEAAPDAEAVRRAVLAGVCQQAAHRNDPACTSAAESRR